MTQHVLKNSSKPLLSILAKLDELRRFTQLLAEHVPPEITNHCQVAKFEKNCLIVIVENGNWATQLRFQIPDLLAKLRHYPGLEKLNGICCKTRPPISLPKSAKLVKRSVARLTAETAETILETAATISDKKLRLLLEKIAKDHRE